MRAYLVTGLRVALVTLVITGVLYPLLVTAGAQLLFSRQAHGSLVALPGGRVVGSEHIGQDFTRAGYLQPRPSAAGKEGYDAASSGGSNFGPTSEKLRARVKERAEALRKANPEAPGPIPPELVTASASGLDPHLSPEAARWQAPRIARARGVPVGRVLAVIDSLTEGRTFGVLGEPRVNVLKVNLELDRQLAP